MRELSGETGVTLRCEWGYETKLYSIASGSLGRESCRRDFRYTGENYQCAAVGENVLSHECGCQSQHSGNEHEYIRVSQRTLGLSPAMLLGVNREMGQCV